MNMNESLVLNLQLVRVIWLNETKQKKEEKKERIQRQTIFELGLCSLRFFIIINLGHVFRNCPLPNILFLLFYKQLEKTLCF